MYKKILIWVIGLAISVWTGAMGVSALFRTESAKKWFEDMLKQSSTVMTINGAGIIVASLLVLGNLFFQ